MMENDSIHFDPTAEIDRYFDDSSLAITELPRAMIIAGGVAAGKTGLRRARYSAGSLCSTRPEIFLSLCQDKYLGIAKIVDFKRIRCLGTAKFCCRNTFLRREGIEPPTRAFSVRCSTN